jgi:hypothetical protein
MREQTTLRERWTRFEGTNLKAYGNSESWVVVDTRTEVKVAYVDSISERRYEVHKPRSRKVLGEVRTLRQAIVLLQESGVGV